MTFDEWWEEFESVHPDHKFADSAALRKAAFEAGKLEAAQTILKLWHAPWGVTRMSFYRQP